MRDWKTTLRLGTVRCGFMFNSGGCCRFEDERIEYENKGEHKAKKLRKIGQRIGLIDYIFEYYLSPMGHSFQNYGGTVYLNSYFTTRRVK